MKVLKEWKGGFKDASRRRWHRQKRQNLHPFSRIVRKLNKKSCQKSRVFTEVKTVSLFQRRKYIPKNASCEIFQRRNETARPEDPGI